MRRWIAACVAPGVLTAAFVSAGQQSPAQQPQVFRGAANLVYVDVYPKRNGRFLDGLRAQDFQVFEDGTPQKVDTFELIRFAANTPGDFRRDPTSQTEGDQLAADPRNRVFVVYLDLYHVGVRGSYESRGPLVEFLRTAIGPSDLFTVLTPLQYVSAFVFSRRTDTIESELADKDNTYWGQARGGMLVHTPHEELLQTCLPRPSDGPPSISEANRRSGYGNELVRIYREDLLMTSLENLVHRLGALKDQRKNVLFISQGWVPQGPRLDLLKDINERLPTIGVGPTGRLGLGNRTSSRDVTACDREIGRLASIDFQRRFQDLLTLASRANVSFYPVDVGGESRFTSRGPIETLRTLADATDGRAILQLYTDDLAPGFRQIAEDLQAYYLLGYYSTNAAEDGRFREIDVKIAQPGVSLTARRGYLAPSQAMRRAADAAAARLSAAPEIPLPVTAALADLARIRADAALYGAAVRTSAGLSITLELTSRELASGRWSEGGAVEVTVTGADAGSPATVKTPLAAGARSIVLSLPVASGTRGPWKVRGRMTSDRYVVEETFDARVPEGGPLGDVVWYRGAAAASAPMRPAAERVFRRTERMRAEWPIDAPLDSRLARLLDRRGEPLAVGAAVTEFERDGQRLLAVDVSLAPLADGDYLIELVAGQGAGSVRRLVAFRVTR